MNVRVQKHSHGSELALGAVRADRAYSEFLPSAVEVAVRPVPKIVPVILLVIVAAIAVALAWSWFFYLHVFTNAAGRVRSTMPSAVVQPMETGRVVSINVENDLKVKARDPVLVLDDVDVRATLKAAVASRHSWQAEVDRRQSALAGIETGAQRAPRPKFVSDIPPEVVARELAALDGEYQTVSANIAAIRAQRREVEARKKRFENVAVAQRELNDILDRKIGIFEALVSGGVASKGALLTAEEAKARADAELVENLAQLAEADASIQNLVETERQTIAAFVAQQSQGIQAAERQIEQIDQEIVRQQARLDQLVLRAPIDGTVQQLSATSVGQVVGAGQTLMVVVPRESQLVVDALIPSADIGFVHEGNEVTIKADAFPFTRYGTFRGTVTSLSDDAMTPENAHALQDPSAVGAGRALSGPSGSPTVTDLFYIARISIADPMLKVDGSEMRLEPGMTVRAEIQTESRRLIDYVLSPVTEVFDEAGHER
ncbi:HlyD family secretion protein (plasmid) [Rhizobium sp. NXC14]|uniref:HlyD family type I secretion periplasmic adaptor subunit n=1 Tax=Rhizobium sp. NXC14 TaxID=1981173 RepID=UPI000A20AEC9|nr:HlyD family type I secretion periplasmic adaptor subunit [Rhizobium sp. NXC14]ARO34319.1 HlyD family secretion protein [Rhizobium sp. NXC14]